VDVVIVNILGKKPLENATAAVEKSAAPPPPPPKK
jgi:hypothetical protein